MYIFLKFSVILQAPSMYSEKQYKATSLHV